MMIRCIRPSLISYILFLLFTLTILPEYCRHCHTCVALSSSSLNQNANNNNGAFSLSAYQKARALETSESLDASRLHFQILFVDDDNAKGRIAEGILAKVAEYNDAMFVLFPASSTIANARNAPRDAAPSSGALGVCASLGLCSFRSEAIGTAFDLSYLDEYDLIVAMDDDIRSLILRSLDDDPANQNYYASKCRSFSEFLSADFCGSIGNLDGSNNGVEWMLDMLDGDLQDRVLPFSERVLNDRIRDIDIFWNAKVPIDADRAEMPRILLTDQGAAVPNMMEGSWSVVETALVLASAGLTRFCLDTIDAQFDAAFQTLLDQIVCRPNHLELQWDAVDEQLSRCSAAVSGYFSPQQRKEKIERHCQELRKRLQ